MTRLAEPSTSVLDVPTPAERNALLFVAALATLGVGVRGARALRTTAPPADDRAALATQIASVDSLVARGGRERPPRRAAARTSGGAAADAAARTSSPRTPTPRTPTPRTTSARAARADPLDSLRRFPLDLDRATVTELERLPGIGPALATRIVADRDSLGPFGSVEGLQRVKGVGPALATRVQPFVTFSLSPRPPDAEFAAGPRARRP